MKDGHIAVGIDLGTTNTVLAIVDDGAKEPRVVETRDAQPQMPSIVGVQRPRGKKKAANPVPVEIVVGTTARKNMETAAPEDTIYSIKRLMGRSFDDPNVADVRARVPYKIVRPSDGTSASVKVILDKKELSPVDISQMILRKIKDDAEFSLSGKAIKYAVITVPTYFNADQRQATRDAGIAAGLTVMKILDEPIAAAYDYKLPIEGMETKDVLVFDFGGGTFDLSILSGQAGAFLVKGRGGDMWLGGDDLDRALETPLIDQMMDPEGDYGFDPRKNPKAMGRLRREVREAKESLVSQSSVEVSLGEDIKGRDGEVITLGVTREMLERVIAPIVYSFRVCSATGTGHSDSEVGLIDVTPPFTTKKEHVHWTRLHLPHEKACTTCGESLADALVREGKTRAHVNATLAAESMKRSFIDFVIMAGNSTREPLVQRAMEEDFGTTKILRVGNPKHSVALGAAKVAASMRHLVCDKGHVNEFGAETCGYPQCGARLGAPSALPKPPTVTSSFYYGIDWPGLPFQSFVSKGEDCPTPDDKIQERSFPTVVTNQRMMTLPIFARDSEKNPTYNESQYKGLAVLPRGLPQKSLIKLKLWLDGSGTLQISGALGNGTSLKPFRLQGGAESKLIEALEALGKKMGDLLPLLRDRIKGLKKEIDDVFDLALAGSEKFAEAAARVAALSRRIEAAGDVSGAPGGGLQVAISFVNFVGAVVRSIEFLFPPAMRNLFMALAESIVRAVNAKQDPLPAVLDVIKQANIIVTVEGTGSRHKKDLYDLVMEAVAEARQESQPPPPDILTVLRMMLALIPPPLMNIVNAKVAIDMMRDERPADAANLSEDLNVELKKVRLQEPGAEKGVSEAVGRILKESQQATADVKCPQGHVVLVRYCNGPEQWDSWSMGPGGSPR